ncbi:hypothetical protein GALMADRAFT_245759 [Galerina marginata CBS 339.88]|uniref:L-ornithine N(5)-oxygenase n=1 Tax=Galerina marginata (strain CBS 339.88) TaxID=685588 RepID=A0A067T5I9_GALM3|nr:hypothetical protein GALMADRAFT_245759 [Galerina marginata CBS 339.88]
MASPLSEPIAILGAGVAGLINAYVLLQDGFTNVTLITRDRSVGGTWSRDRVYPGLRINNVHGEYRFSPLEMPPPKDSAETGGHISGTMMCEYMETFYSKFLKDKAKFRFKTEILNVKREDGSWQVKVEDVISGHGEFLSFARIILCTGGCSTPKIPHELSLEAAEKVRFRGIVIHSSQFCSRYDDILASVKPKKSDSDEQGGAVLVVGGGKSAMDICAKLANEGRRVINAFDSSDIFLASRSTLPEFIRKSRFLSLLSPHIHLKTRLERFFHSTTLGSWITRFIFRKLEESSFAAYDIPANSPLRRTPSLFWGIRTNDEGRAHAGSYYSLVNAGQIEIVAPTRTIAFSDDGRSVLFNNHKAVSAQVVILATGWQSSWSNIFDEKTATELGIGRHAPTTDLKDFPDWNYKTLSNPPTIHAENETQKYVTSVYRGLVPARNINKRDFAIGGATFSANFGYTLEVAAHWISSYFRGDPMRLPSSPKEAIADAEIRSAWMRRRYPNMLSWVNESYSCTLDFWTWPQAADELLEDMYVPSMRSGGNWLTWAFRVIDLKELSTLHEERRLVREKGTVSS